MKTNKLTLLTVATIATATLGIKGVNADESDRGITPETTTITANQGDTASEKTDKPKTPAPKETPKVEEVKITNRVENHAQSTRNDSEETVKAYSAPVTLPNTGSEFGSAISLIGLLGLSLGVVGMAKKEN